MRAILVGLLLTCVAGCEPKSPADAFLDDPAALKRGKLIFVGTCGGYCHGPSLGEMQGGGTQGARDAPYLFDCVWRHGGTDQAVYDTIANGVPGTRMISFDGKLPEGASDIWRIVAYLKSERRSC